MNDDDLDTRLARLARTADVDPRALDALVGATRTTAQSLRRRLGAALGLIAVLVIGGGVIAAPASADVVRHFLAQLGIPVGGGSEVIPESEWVDLEASDLRAYIDHVFPDETPLPPSLTREEIIDRTYAIWSTPDAMTQEVGLRRSVESFAYCGWAMELIDAQRDGDEGRYDHAAAIVLSAADWPALVATDGGGITDRLREVGTAAVEGERGAGWDVYAAGDCDILGFSSDAE